MKTKPIIALLILLVAGLALSVAFVIAREREISKTVEALEKAAIGFNECKYFTGSGVEWNPVLNMCDAHDPGFALCPGDEKWVMTGMDYGKCDGDSPNVFLVRCCK